MLITTLRFPSQNSIRMIGCLIYINYISSNSRNMKRSVHAIYFAVQSKCEACKACPSQDHAPMKSTNKHSFPVLARSSAQHFE